MNDVSGSGNGPRASGKSSRASDANFEYIDDSEWDVGIGNLIIDLDADIEKNNEDNRSANDSVINSSVSNSPVHNNTTTTTSPSLTPPITIPSPMHIPTTSGSSGSSNNSSNNSKTTKSSVVSNNTAFPPSTNTKVVGGTGELSAVNSMEHSAVVDKGLKMKIKRTKTGTKSGVDAKHEIVKSDSSSTTSIGSSNNNNINSNTNSKNNSSVSDKSAHSSSTHKDKDKLKDGSLMIDGDIVVGSGATGATTNNGIKDTDQGKLSVKKPKETRKKAKIGNGSSKKDEKDSKGNSIHTGKDGKEYFSTTVSLNVPTIVPNASSAFSKTMLKVPGTNASLLSNSQNPMQINPLSDSSSSRNNNNTNNNHSTSNPPPWVTGSPNKAPAAGDKNLISSLSNDRGNANPLFGKKIKSMGLLSQEDANAGGTGLSAIASSYKNSDLSSISATVNHQGPLGISSPKSRNSQPVATNSVCIGTSVGTVTDPDCLGPCEPGTAVTLEGIVWHENENGILVVNVTWRGKTYVGTLIDCTKNDWAPPRFCDSPTSDLELRTPKNRAKRGGRGQAGTPVNELPSELRVANVKLRNGAKGRRGSASNTAFVAPASPLRGEQWPKRKTRGSENESQDEPAAAKSATKRLKVSKEERKDRQSNSPIPSSSSDALDMKSAGPSSPALIECPEPNCSKKYKHINGLRYHQTHAHFTNFAEDSDSNASTTSTQLITPTDTERPSSEPMSIDNVCDLDGESPTNVSDDSPAVVKIRNGKVDDPQDENARLDGSEDVNMSSLSGKSENKNGKVAKDSLDKDADPLSSKNNKKEVLPGRVPAILTVPIPFISLQNRAVSHSVNILSQDNTTVMKPTPLPAGNSSILQAKGISWQPHVHNPVVSSPIHSQQSPNSATLNIPLTSADKLKDKSSTESHSKKNKHKKKNKEKDKEGKLSKSDGKGEKSKSAKFSNLTSSDNNSDGMRDSHPDDLRIPRRDEYNFLDSSGTGGNPGESRDDPQSPAYSDISDANDSGDVDIGITGKEGVKTLGVGNPEINKKDATATVPVAPYFSPFYSPYLDSKLGENKPPQTPEEVEKLKSKSLSHSSHIPPPPSGSNNNPIMVSSNSNINPSNPDQDNSRRSPKMDFHHPKYLPQQFFHYPYSNYHFEQGQFNNMMPPDAAYNPQRGFPGGEDREKEREMMMSKISDRDPLGLNIKQEPGLKDGRQNKGDDKIGGEIKSEFGSDYSDPKSLPNSNPMINNKPTHFGQPCSKHSKEHKQRDEASKSGKDDLDREKERKDEGSKPTMETQGPPPAPTAGSYAYIPQPYLQPGSPFGLHFPDPSHPLYRQVMVPGPYGTASPYMHPGQMPRYPQPPTGSTTPLPEDLSRQNAPPTAPAAKALDLLQHHAQYYQVHKIHELSERALKSPSPQVGQRDREASGGIPTTPTNNPTSPAGGPGQSPRSNSINMGGPSPNVPKPADLSKESSKIGPGIPMNESSRSPPTQHHVHSHTHHHTHVGIGYPILPTAFPTSGVYGVLPTPAGSTPPFPSSQKPN